MQGETHALASWLPVAVQVGVPIALALIAALGTWGVSQRKAKNDVSAQAAAHELAIAAQQEEFDGKKREMAMARDQQMYDTQQQIITTLQTSNRDSAHREARMDEKFNELYGNLGYERDYSTEWEEWHRNGMPDPPGKPKRRHPTHQPATPPGG
ncbi:hypothetical protein [Arthrobacter glacialis]|uniref:hypothetical protein n=1 Tax=Arthrobacter glacialis TaxID=1664 RepID=UPI000CD3ADC8|nr:hypothetical protein [Arthrobacter glacialis]POH58929.1 hypothetical protein CVS28_09485 [Arthrobacter glacialis]